MSCQSGSASSKSDQLELLDERPSSANTAITWLVQQGIIFLNSIDEKAAYSYKHVIELLSKEEAVNAMVHLIRTTSKTDTTLQWSLLYIVGDIGDKSAAKWLAQYSIEQLPARGRSCEGPYDAELLLRSMAIESIKKIAIKDKESSEYLVEIISHHPDRGVLAEAVKAAVELGLKDEIAKILPKEDQWMIDIRKAKIEEFHADPERADSGEVGFTPPKRVGEYTAPSIKCACTKGGSNHG